MICSGGARPPHASDDCLEHAQAAGHMTQQAQRDRHRIPREECGQADDVRWQQEPQRGRRRTEVESRNQQLADREIGGGRRTCQRLRMCTSRRRAAVAISAAMPINSSTAIAHNSQLGTRTSSATSGAPHNNPPHRTRSCR